MQAAAQALRGAPSDIAARPNCSLRAGTRFAVEDHVIRKLVELGLVENAKQITIAGPSIELIDPPLLLQDRQAEARVQVYSSADEKPIIGRVTAASGVLTVMINDRRIQPEADGIFHSTARWLTGPEQNKQSDEKEGVHKL